MKKHDQTQSASEKQTVAKSLKIKTSAPKQPPPPLPCVMMVF